jgi:protein-tyrosine phosphatase
MGNKLYVDSKVSQIEDLLNYDIENISATSTPLKLPTSEEASYQNLKVWRFFESETEEIHSEGIVLPKIKEEHFLLSSYEAYIILLVYKGKDDLSEISAFPTTLWGIVESSSNMTPRGLQYAFSTSSDQSENLESFLLSKRDFKDSDFKYVLFIWNGKNCSPILKSRVLMKAFDLDKKLSSPKILPFLYHGYWIKNISSSMQKGKVLKLNEIISNTLENLTEDNNLPTPNSETVFNYHETVYLLHWLYPLCEGKKNQQGIGTLPSEKKSPSKNRGNIKFSLFSRFNKNFLTTEKGKSFYDLFTPLEKGGRGSINNSMNTNLNLNNFKLSDDAIVNSNRNKNHDKKDGSIENSNENSNENENSIERNNSDLDNSIDNQADDIDEQDEDNEDNENDSDQYNDDNIDDEDLDLVDEIRLDAGKNIIKPITNSNLKLSNLNTLNTNNIASARTDNSNIVSNIPGGKLNLTNINSNTNNSNNKISLKINLGDINKAYSSTDTDHKDKSSSNNTNTNTNSVTSLPGLKVPKLNMKLQHKILNDDMMSQRTKQISEEEEKLDSLPSNTIRKVSDIIINSVRVDKEKGVINPMLKKLDFKSLNLGKINTTNTYNSSHSLSQSSRGEKGDRGEIKFSNKSNVSNKSNNSSIPPSSERIEKYDNSSNPNKSSRSPITHRLSNREKENFALNFNFPNSGLNSGINSNSDVNSNLNTNRENLTREKEKEKERDNSSPNKQDFDIDAIDEDYDLKESERKKLIMEYFSKTMSEIIPDFLYLSSYNVAKNKEIVYDHKITHIINSAADVCQNHFEDDSNNDSNPIEYKISYLSFNLKDHAMENIECLFYEIIQFIENARVNNGRVLVHCIQGISRSVTLVLAYLMFSQKLNYDEAFKIVSSKRSIASPNLGFSIQLQNFYQRLYEPPNSFRLNPKIFAIGSFQAEQSEKIVCRLMQEQFFEPRYNNTMRVFDKRGVFIVVTLECVYMWIGEKIYANVKKQ